MTMYNLTPEERLVVDTMRRARDPMHTIQIDTRACALVRCSLDLGEEAQPDFLLRESAIETFRRCVRPRTGDVTVHFRFEDAVVGR